jgi:hypothetical protein
LALHSSWEKCLPQAVLPAACHHRGAECLKLFALTRMDIASCLGLLKVDASSVERRPIFFFKKCPNAPLHQAAFSTFHAKVKVSWYGSA